MQDRNQETDIKTLVRKWDTLPVIHDNRGFLHAGSHDIQNRMPMPQPTERFVIKSPPTADIKDAAGLRQPLRKQPRKKLRTLSKPKIRNISNQGIEDTPLAIPDFTSQRIGHKCLSSLKIEGAL
jgi:hypothetical protein